MAALSMTSIKQQKTQRHINRVVLVCVLPHPSPRLHTCRVSIPAGSCAPRFAVSLAKYPKPMLVVGPLWCRFLCSDVVFDIISPTVRFYSVHKRFLVRKLVAPFAYHDAGRRLTVTRPQVTVSIMYGTAICNIINASQSHMTRPAHQPITYV